MTRKHIPGLIGIVGALFAALSAVGSGVAFYSITKKIDAKRVEQQELDRKRDELWDSHILAESREMHAEIIRVLARLQNGTELDELAYRLFLYELAYRRFKDAWMTMGVAADLPIAQLSDALRKEEETGLLRFKTRDFNERIGFLKQRCDFLQKEIDSRKLRSRDPINSRRDEIAAIDRTLKQLEKNAKIVFYAGLVLTSIGGIITALKDILIPSMPTALPTSSSGLPVGSASLDARRSGNRHPETPG